jgi:23S rRNA (cytosine1962-C5)-methyltransferase
MPSTLPVVRVNRKAADRIASGHLWVFASDVTDRGETQPGDAVRVVDARGQSLGTAHYSSSSQITLRMLSPHSEEAGLNHLIGHAFLKRRIEAAAQLRGRVVENTTAYRLVYADADWLPGLIIDRYGDYFAAQFLDQGMDRLAPVIGEVLEELYQPAAIVARNDASVRAKENLPLETKVLAGEITGAVPIEMNGLLWEVDLLGGQKTGIFLDQRENYVAARVFGRGKVLDCFTATGGFALHLAGLSESVEAVDSSAAALEAARSNAALNQVTNVRFRQADVLEYLPAQVAAHRTFDMVIVDPPAFTKARGAVEGATRGYKEINLRALRLLRSGGILVSCSCSHHMSEARLLEIVLAAALDSGKRLRVLERRTQARDHPMLLAMPETLYLKCIILQVIE